VALTSRLAMRLRACACGGLCFDPLAFVELHLRRLAPLLAALWRWGVGRVRCDFPPASGPGASPASAGALVGAGGACAGWGRASGA
jgi:hypothetical protein